MTTIAAPEIVEAGAPRRFTDSVAVRFATDPSPAWWRSDRRDTWTGRLGRRVLLGTVRRTGIDYTATNRRGEELGRFPSLAEAETAISATVFEVADALDRSYQRGVAIVAASAGVVAALIAVIGILVLQN